MGAMLAGALAASRLMASEGDALLARWLAMQTNVATWSADFVQTRRLKALTSPLEAKGRVWFEAPARFRWELGQPARSIVLRTDADLLVLSPGLRRAEHYPVATMASGPAGDVLALLEGGFPRDAAGFTNRFELLSSGATNGLQWLRFRPRSEGARRLLSEFSVLLATPGMELHGTELVMRDGSTMRTDFVGARLNGPLPAGWLASPVDATWKVTQPLGEGPR
jgi:outer membrane lipoprotein-sorting protein